MLPNAVQGQKQVPVSEITEVVQERVPGSETANSTQATISSTAEVTQPPEHTSSPTLQPSLDTRAPSPPQESAIKTSITGQLATQISPPATSAGAEAEAEAKAEVEAPELPPPTTTTVEEEYSQSLFPPLGSPLPTAQATEAEEAAGQAEQTQPQLSSRLPYVRTKITSAPLPLIPSLTPTTPLQLQNTLNTQLLIVHESLSNLTREIKNLSALSDEIKALGTKVEKVEEKIEEGRGPRVMFGNVENIYLQGFEDLAFRRSGRNMDGGERGEEDP